MIYILSFCRIGTKLTKQLCETGKKTLCLPFTGELSQINAGTKGIKLIF